MALLKVACITPSLPFERYETLGGAESYVQNLSNELANLGNQVSVFSVISGGEKIPNRNFQIKGLKTIRSPAAIFGYANPFPIDLLPKLCETQVDIIHIHQLQTFLHVASYIAGKIKRVPIVLTNHGGRRVPFPRLLAQLPTVFAAVSRYSARNLLRYAPGKPAFVIYGGADTRKYYPENGSEVLRRRLRIGDAEIILFVGRVLPHKGIDVLIRALSRVIKLSRRNIKALVVGPTLNLKYYEHLQLLVRHLNLDKNVLFCGAVGENELPKYYRLCDVFVLPSVNIDYLGNRHPHPELLSLTSLEAMACGKAVIASRIGGLLEIVKEGETGVLVEPGYPQKLAGAIQLLLEDEELRQRLSNKALAVVREFFTWKMVARRTIAAYNAILAKL